MDNVVPDYIFASGLSAQQARSRRTSRPVSPPASPRTPTSAPSSTQDLEIKAVVGHLHNAHRAWPVQMQFDIPRLVKL
ncbi:hypothetical protein COEREDRAFT_83517 [Coemansia reversa NRRL 1564]|uniref:Uncharacterized protein n=1 Tax=Coemansia reversa (strain ATCC 12441 / NRRL 1564) TaxID=763665 RepID=A0A2G5B329_COERN|nr:hypothetical protein COEREDRAFT_83517 [Coemansia reversa NRRL 1564]|eukprot:PIA13404.1 hypothetical protein COEREDRAFT_83517 [Coemansia reversa NRRL 1564]